ncbi:MAG: hypothetical protein ACOCQQ_02580 [Candidatus Nanoarchaeia archaeon]
MSVKKFEDPVKLAKEEAMSDEMVEEFKSLYVEAVEEVVQELGEFCYKYKSAGVDQFFVNEMFKHSVYRRFSYKLVEEIIKLKNEKIKNLR